MPRGTLFVLALVAILGAAPAAAQAPTPPPAEWRSSGRDLANTGFNPDETRITRDSVADLAVRWRFRGGPVYGTPVVTGNRTYIADAAGVVHARDARYGWWVGRVVYRDGPWSLDVGAVSAPVVTDDSIYVVDRVGTARRIRRTDGDILWATRVDPNPNALVLGDPIVHDGHLLVPVSSFENDVVGEDLTMRGSVVALDADSGAVAWQTFTTSDQTLEHPKYGAGVGVWSSPAIDAGRGLLYIGTGQHYEPGSPAPDPASIDDVDYSDSLLAIDLADGTIVDHHQFTAGDVWGLGYPDGHDWDVGIPPNLFTIPAAEGGGTLDVVGVGDKKGMYYVLDRDTLAVVWSRTISRPSVIGGLQATAAVVGDTVFVAGHELFDGNSFNDVIPEGQSFTWLSSAEGFRVQQEDARVNVVALDAATGDVRWQRTLYEGAAFAPVIATADLVFVATADGRVRALGAADGEVLWEARIGFRFLWRDFRDVPTAMSIAGGRLYVAHFGFPGGVTVFGLPGD